MPLLIDSYNVLHTVGVLPPDLAGIELPDLVRLLQASRYRTEKTTLVCDGSPETASQSAKALTEPRGELLTIRYSGPGRKADDLIAKLILASTAPRRLLVISSDHEIMKAARRRRCPTLTSQEFLSQLTEDARGERAAIPVGKPAATSMNPGQVERWVKLFRLDAETLALESGAGAPTALHAEQPAESNEATPAPSHEATPPTVPRELPPGPVLPVNLIAEAEAMWNRHHRDRQAGQDSPQDSDQARADRCGDRDDATREYDER